LADSEIKLAVIGLGLRMAVVVTHLCRVDPRLRLLGVCDPQPVGLPLLDSAGVPSGDRFDDPARMLETLSPDWVLVGSPNHLHLEHIRMGLEAGCRVFSEKPVVRTQDETWELCRLLASHGASRLIVGLVLRSAPLVVAVCRHLEAGRLGRIVSAEANEHLHPEHGGFLARDWRRRSEWGGSLLLDKCCHDFDLYRLFVGALPARVVSFAGRSIFTREGADLADRRYPSGHAPYRLWPRGWQAADDSFADDGDAADHQVALVEYANGVRLAFHLNSHSGVVQRRWLLAGTLGTLEADLQENRLLLRDVVSGAEAIRESFELDPAGHSGADRAMARDLAAHMLDDRPFPVSAYDALVAGLTVMAVDRSAETGQVVDCQPLWHRLDALFPA
jgi:predicted dehydrogenase